MYIVMPYTSGHGLGTCIKYTPKHFKIVLVLWKVYTKEARKISNQNTIQTYECK